MNERGVIMNETCLSLSELAWQEAPGYPAGTQRKILRQENRPVTMLLKLPSGFHIDEHCHTTTEQHFVMEGEYTSEGKTYGPGSYRLIPAEASHGPFTSETGVVVLIIWDPC